MSKNFDLIKSLTRAANSLQLYAAALLPTCNSKQVGEHDLRTRSRRRLAETVKALDGFSASQLYSL